jgi:hypothetical protein
VADPTTLAAATDAVPARARREFHALVRSHAFQILQALFGIAAAGVGALAPADGSGTERFLIPVAAALGAFLLSYVLAAAWSLLLAPIRQRAELAEIVKTSAADPKPTLTMEPGVAESEEPMPTNEVDSFGQPVKAKDTRYDALIHVKNSQKQGGERAIAKHVTAVLEVLDPSGDVLYERTGWDSGAWRHFTTSGERHGLLVAVKWRREAECLLVQEPGEEPARRLPVGGYDVKLTLWGYQPEEPVVARFVLSNRGKGEPLRLERSDGGTAS